MPSRSDEIRKILTRLENIEVLRQLFAELNYEYEDEPLTISLPDSIQPHVYELKTIAQRNGFKIILCKIDRLLKGLERKIIEQISRVHFHALIIFTDTSEKEWHFTNVRIGETKDEIQKKLKEIGIRRRTFRRLIVGESERLRTASERLALIEVDEKETALQIHRKINKAFDVQQVSEDFYRDFVQYYKFFRKELAEMNSIAEDEADYHTQIIFNRLFFLYFLQKKRLLDGNPFYFKDKLDQISDDENFYEDVLIPLFKKLSIPNYRDVHMTNIPFLNGGLFEFDEEEEYLIVENWLIRTIINDLFERYNFTVREETEWEQEVAIDPEMLGTIFERLILGLESKKYKDIPDPRRASGSYYTPKFIVSFIVKQALLNYLHDKLENEIPRKHLKELIFQYRIDEFSDKQLEKVKEALLNIKVIDPGVGSGAFPVDLLLKMVELIETIDRKINPDAIKEKNYRYHLKRKIIEKNIYGVDIQKRAVDLAHLRLWLSLIVDLEVETVEEIPPLPNLDFNFYVGDSLKSKIGDYDFDIQREMTVDEKGLRLIDDFIKLKIEYQDLQNKEDKELQKNKIQKKKRELLEWFFNNKKREVLKKLKSIESQTKLELGLPESELPLKKYLIEELEKIEDHLDRLDEFINEFNLGLDFFDIMEMNKGFDAVIGNPPYGVKVSDKVKEEFGLGSKDSYGVFTALGLKILRPGGTLSYIMSDTWQTIRTHKPLRDKLLYETDVQYLIFVPNDTFSATVNPGVYSFVKREHKQKNGGDNWILAADFSPLKIRQPDGRLDSSNLEAAFDILLDIEEFDESKDGYTIISDRDMAIYAYRQNLITRYSNHSFFIASPKLFKLMQDMGNVKNEIRKEDEPTFFSIYINDKEIILTKIKYLVEEICGGIKSYNNKKYIKSLNGNDGYEKIDTSLIVNRKLTKEEQIHGIKRINHSTPYYLRFDKGGKTINENTYCFYNYYCPTEFYFPWDTNTVKELTPLNALRNKHRYFSKGIGFTAAGIYSPLFRYSELELFQNGYQILFLKKDIDEYFLLGVLCSKLIRFLFNTYINHTVNSNAQDIESIPIVINNNHIINIVKKIIFKLNNDLNYDYTEEQFEIDMLVFKMYNLNKDDIIEIEKWFNRRYPKLARVIEEKLNEKNSKEV